MLIYLWISLITLIAGMLQAITGFGGGIIIMIVLPNLISMNLAPAISGVICTPLAWSIAFKYRKWCNFKKIILPTIFYIVASTIAIKISTIIDMNALKPVFGIFLILLAIYFMLFSNKIHIKGTILSAFVCSVISGALGGLFGIGGPLLVLYFLAISDTKQEYLGNINGVFAITTLYQMIARIAAGILTLQTIPMIIIGIIGILIGRFWGSKVVDRLDVEKMKKIIYIFLAFAGTITVINSL